MRERAAWLRAPRFSAIWIATALLFAISPVLASGSISYSALLSTLPFAAILIPAGTRTAGPAHTSLNLSVRHLGISNVHGNVKG